jgi:2-keto-4-pentenoate hydratase/2-oxohepta-3-ene-1,7-dioic acid hydratase in catechol pathway
MTFSVGAEARLGAIACDGGIVDLAARDGHEALRSMQGLIEAGESGLSLAGRLTREAQETLDPASVTWLAPLPCPLQMRDFLAFEEHMRMAGWRGAQLRARWGGPPAPEEPMPIPPVWYDQPIYYKCNRFAVSGPDQITDWPAYSRVIDYELELACVIGKTGRDIPLDAADDHIFGYTIFNDLTARDAQFREMQGPLGPAKGKDFDGANILGPVIVTRDEIGDVSALAMRAYVNGELWSEGSAGSMHWSFGSMIAYLSSSETLHAGEILGSGTVGGGCGLELGRFLKDGDRVELEVDAIGRIATTIIAPHVPEAMRL